MKNDVIEKLVAKYTEELYNWAFYKTSSSEVAEDLVQETFLAAVEKIDSFKGDSSHKTWLFSILNYKIIDHYRKKVKQPVQMESDTLSSFFDEDGSWIKEKRPREWHDEDSQLLDKEDFRLILQKCLEALPEKWNTCVNLKYLSNKNGDEICQEIGITTTNFWQIIHRAKLNLRNCIDDNWFAN
ncbi:sigma-70 family RNA polymerase sigma factor [Bacteroidota bacterium]